MKHLIPHNKVMELMLSGNSQLIFENSSTGNHRRYRIREKGNNVYYVTLASTNLYLGYIYNDTFHAAAYTVNGAPVADPEALKFKYLFDKLLECKLSPNMRVYHTGMCCVCGRPLTDPESISLGIGPKCRGER